MNATRETFGPNGLPPQARGAWTAGHAQAIARSHERCVADGLTRIEFAPPDPLARADLSLIRERNCGLHAHAAPVMEMLHGQIVDTQSMVVLCDAAGTLLHSIGDDEFLARAAKVALQPGVNWSERTKGTNAIGTALVEEQPTLVHGGEHYLHANDFLTCSAAPILDPRGHLVGALDVTGDHRSYHQHTMALVKMSARMIENRWLDDEFRDAIRLRLHTRAELIGTLAEGVVALSPEGRILGANRGALELLGQSGVSLRHHTLWSLFGSSIGTLADRCRGTAPVTLESRTPAGHPMQLHARLEGPLWRRGVVVNLPDPAALQGPTPRSLAALEVQAMRDAVDACGGNISGAARRLRISRSTLYRKLRQHSLPGD